MTDPYRTPAAVETDEQRVERLRKTYWYMAGSGTPTDPAKRAEAMAQLETARKAWLNAVHLTGTARVIETRLADRYHEAMNGMTQQQRDAYQALFVKSSTGNGAGNGTP